MKKLLLAGLLLTSSLFAGGFDTPYQAIDFWHKVSSKASYSGDVSAQKKLAPHTSMGTLKQAANKISSFRTGLKRANAVKEFGYIKKLYKVRNQENTYKVRYWKYDWQKKIEMYWDSQEVKAKKINGKIKWFIH